LVACNYNEEKRKSTKADSINNIPETTRVAKEAKPEPYYPKHTLINVFKNVTVERIGKDKFLVRGQGQIFEANFSWIVEDGHVELKKGFQMTDAGALSGANLNLQLASIKSVTIQH
jgi:hypothetical protein